MSGKPTFVVGQRVFFWTGRASQGHGTIRAFREGRALIDPEPDAIKGSDYRARGDRDYWGPRDWGVPVANLNTSPRPWFENS